MKAIESKVSNLKAAKDLIGQRIRAYDFKPVRVNGEPRDEYPDTYVEGLVTGVEMIQGSYMYVVDCTQCSHALQTPDKPNHSRVGEVVFAAVEVSIMDWNGRINLIEEK